ncbi:nuclear transport factor 2 family protein [Spirosoma sp. BT702]|uniref:Nuclear transport factor 2 family protein n=1 Tax=Spirosoma profusum TaxID=2771354 RepID=A0A927AQZ0_9BACT|nr:nuclear transport factor 2 family protein [Spirosoma profusum]MBD2701503.1 nuclear transport factor 2 family protein [Spirosoma profusum]
MKSLLRIWLLVAVPYLVLAQVDGNSKVTESADVASIRALRLQSNQAIEGRNLQKFGETMLPDIQVTRGSGSHVSGRDSVLASVAPQFKDPNFLGYVRTTERIDISTSAPLAAEHGHWVGRFRKPDGIQTITGTYLSMWRKTDTGWKIRSELFISLSCTGSEDCGK